MNYRIYSEAGKVWLSFDRPGDPAVHGKRELLYYIGQGRRGRSYLFSDDGFVFESPVNLVHRPAHVGHGARIRQCARNSHDTTCADQLSRLPCQRNSAPHQWHRKSLQNASVLPMRGVTCERCHGPGAAHVNGGAIVNPAKLSAERRDQVCMQCHLEGNAAIERAGKHLYEYRPGDDLSDYIRYYVLVGLALFEFAGRKPVRVARAEYLQEEIRRCDVMHELSRSASHGSGGRTGDVLSREVPGLPWSNSRGEAPRRSTGLHALPHARCAQQRCCAHRGNRPSHPASSHHRPEAGECWPSSLTATGDVSQPEGRGAQRSRSGTRLAIDC